MYSRLASLRFIRPELFRYLELPSHWNALKSLIRVNYCAQFESAHRVFVPAAHELTNSYTVAWHGRHGLKLQGASLRALLREQFVAQHAVRRRFSKGAGDINVMFCGCLSMLTSHVKTHDLHFFQLWPFLAQWFICTVFGIFKILIASVVVKWFFSLLLAFCDTFFISFYFVAEIPLNRILIPKEHRCLDVMLQLCNVQLCWIFSIRGCTCRLPHSRSSWKWSK